MTTSKTSPLAIVLLVVLLGFGAFVFLPMFGIGGNQIEHGNVCFDVDPSGKQIIFTSSKGDLYLLDLATKMVKRVDISGGTASNVSFAPDGNQIVYSARREDSRSGIDLMNLEYGLVTHLTDEKGVADGDPRISPNGKALCFVRAHRYRPYSMGGMTWDDYDIYWLELPSGKPHRLTSMHYRGASSATFVDDGKSVVYSQQPSGIGLTSGISKVSTNAVEAKSPIEVMSSEQADYHGGSYASDIQFSPDGSMMTFISDRIDSFKYDVFVADKDGHNPRPLGLTKIAAYNQSPKFSADGKLIYVLAGVERNSGSRPIFSLYSIDLAGRVQMIANSSLFTSPETWDPSAK